MSADDYSPHGARRPFTAMAPSMPYDVPNRHMRRLNDDGNDPFGNDGEVLHCLVRALDAEIAWFQADAAEWRKEADYYETPPTVSVAKAQSARTIIAGHGEVLMDLKAYRHIAMVAIGLYAQAGEVAQGDGEEETRLLVAHLRERSTDKDDYWTLLADALESEDYGLLAL